MLLDVGEYLTLSEFMEISIAEALKNGIAAHKAEHFQEADRFYTAILQSHPKHPDANHNMGVLAVDIGKLEDALPFFKIALEVNSRIVQFWLSYIDALIKLGRLDEARSTLKKAYESRVESDAFGQISVRLQQNTSVQNQEPRQEQIQELLDLYTHGQFEEVISRVEALISLFPEAIVLLNLHGASNAALKNYNAAIDSYQQALKIKPDYAEAYCNIGVALQEKGDLIAALANYKQALKIKPDYVEAHNNMAVALKDRGGMKAAIDCLRQAIKIKPDYAEGYNNLGNALWNKGDLDAALEHYKQAFKIKPDFAEAHYNMGNALRDNGDIEEAIDSYRKALKIKSNYAEAYFNMGNALKDKGELDKAIDSYKRALKIQLNYAEVYYNLGICLKIKGEISAAIDAYEQALRIKPDFPEAANNIGLLQQDNGDFDTAIECYKKALRSKPDFPEAHLNMGNVLQDKGEPEAAMESYKKALEIKTDYAEAFYNMGIAFESKGDLCAAIGSYIQALNIKPDYQSSRNNKLRQQAHICDWIGIENDRLLIRELGTSNQEISPLAILSLEDVPQVHRLRSEIFAKLRYKRATLPHRTIPKIKPSRIRIGYFSSDFREHPVAYLIAKMLEVHDRKYFEVYGYSIGSATDDEMRKRLKKAFDVFHDVKDRDDRDIALLAQQDKIDIAIDLNGYTRNNRSGIFAYRAAPVQINYLGYPGTMGAVSMDYIIADHNLIPTESQKFYSEKPIYMPHHYQAQDDTLPISDETLLRSELGLPEKGFVFCAINSTYKITPSEFNIWMRLLQQVDGSVLWLLESNKWVKANLLKEANARGVGSERLVFAQKTSHEKYLAQFRQADLFLDTFTYNAGATASNALWAGLPVLTKLGKGYTARMAGSLLASIGLSELITATEADYEELALELATDSNCLSEIKQKLAANRLSKPLFNTELFTKHLENGYQQAYQRYFDGLEPDIITVCD